MTSAYVLDRSIASWLAEIDPSLAQLPRALPPATGFPEWRLHDVCWTPGQGCRLAFRVRSAGAPASFVGIDVNGPQRAKRDYRADSGLPGLAAASDPAVVADLVRPLVADPVRGVRIEPVRYRSGSRCVLRYDVETPTSVTTLYAKVLLPDAFDTVASLSATSPWYDRTRDRTANASHSASRVTATWRDHHVLVGSGVAGRSVSAALGDPQVPDDERTGLAHRVGALLAGFHAHAPTETTTPLLTWTAAEQLTSTTSALAASVRADARVADRLCSAVDVLASSPPAPAVPVTCHGAFRAGQVILDDGGGLAVLDVDGISRGDAGRDLGSVLAHLRWQGLRLPHQRRTLRGAEDALLAGYEARAGNVDADQLRWWRAAGLLQLAARRYRRLEVAAWPLVPMLADAVDELLADLTGSPGPSPGHNATDSLDLDEMSAVLRAALADTASRPRELQVESAVELASASGRRSVVRYAVRGLDGADASPVIGKVFTEPRRAMLLHQHLRLLSSGPFAHEPACVPEPLGHLPERGLVLYRPCAGDPLDQIGDPAEATRGAALAARWLARLHGSDIVLPRRLLLHQEANSTCDWARMVGQVHPPVAGRARRLAEGWLVAGRSPGFDGNRPIHKDFHAGHVLVGPGVCVIDLDEARQGDPAFDVAHFCTYLELNASTDPSRYALRQVFLDEYAAAGAKVDEETFGPYCVYTWLKIAKQWASGSGPGRTASPARRRDGVVQAITKGEAWLSG